MTRREVFILIKMADGDIVQHLVRHPCCFPPLATEKCQLPIFFVKAIPLLSGAFRPGWEGMGMRVSGAGCQANGVCLLPGFEYNHSLY